MFNSPTQSILSEFHLNLIGKKPGKQYLFLGDRQASSPWQEAGPPPLTLSEKATTRQHHHQSHLEGHREPVSVLLVLIKNDAGRGAWVAQLVKPTSSSNTSRIQSTCQRIPLVAQEYSLNVAWYGQEAGVYGASWFPSVDWSAPAGPPTAIRL